MSIVDVGMGETWIRQQDLELAASRRRRRHTELEALYRHAGELAGRIRAGKAVGADTRGELSRVLDRIDELEADR